MVSPAAARATQATQDRPPRQAASAAGGRHPRGAVQNRRPSQIYRLELVQGADIIAPPRKSSAHLHRPWRATSQTEVLPNDSRLAPDRDGSSRASLRGDPARWHSPKA
jgi:hypothetical protein